MSRVGKMAIAVPAGVTISVGEGRVKVVGPLGQLSIPTGAQVSVMNEPGVVRVRPSDSTAAADAMSGTVRALAANLVLGVTKGFEKKLSLVGVGFRAQAAGTKLTLQVGYSHPVTKEMPEGVKVECPTQTEIVIKGADRQAVGQVSAEIRAIRPPEPYKGKGIRYATEKVVIKETKKK